jgi:multisubunit Na+/H+ antiporter MnhB subunit
MRRLLAANVILAVLLGLHVADHALRQHAGPTGVGAIPAVLGAVAILASLALTVRRDPRAPVAALVVGVGTAIGFLVIHMTPHWSVFSDSYFDRHVDALSWTNMLTNVAAAVLLAVAAAQARAAAAARPAVLPEKMHPPRKVPSSAR